MRRETVLDLGWQREILFSRGQAFVVTHIDDDKDVILYSIQLCDPIAMAYHFKPVPLQGFLDSYSARYFINVGKTSIKLPSSEHPAMYPYGENAIYVDIPYKIRRRYGATNALVNADIMATYGSPWHG